MKKYPLKTNLLFGFILLSFATFAQNLSEKQLQRMYPTDSVVSRYHNNWTNMHYLQRIKQFKKEPLQPGQIVFIGNSITEQGRDWSAKFGGTPIGNRGIAGDVTDGVLYRLDEVIYAQPKAVFLLIGVNDLFSIHHNADKRTTLTYDKIVPSVDFVAKNIRKITRRLHKALPNCKVYVRTVLPTRRSYLKSDILLLNEAIKAQAEKGHYEVIDLYQAFVDEEGWMKKELTRDGVHLNDAGYAVWVEFEKAYIEALSEE